MQVNAIWKGRLVVHGLGAKAQLRTATASHTDLQISSAEFYPFLAAIGLFISGQRAEVVTAYCPTSWNSCSGEVSLTIPEQPWGNFQGFPYRCGQFL